MQSLDLDVLPPSLAVDIPVLDACVRELDVAVVLRQVVLFSPEMNLVRCSVGASIAVGLASIPLLEEPLIVALELGLEHDALHCGASVVQAFRSLKERPIDLRVVRQLFRLLEATVELLAGISDLAAIGFEQLFSTLGEHDECPVTTDGGNRVDETRLAAEVVEVAPIRLEGFVLAFS